MKEDFQQRKYLLLGLVVFSLLFLEGRLFQLQIVQHEQYLEKSRNNQLRPIRLPAFRGRILDRNRSIIADNRASYSVYVTPALMARDTQAVSLLAGLARVDTSWLWRKVGRLPGYSRKSLAQQG